MHRGRPCTRSSRTSRPASRRVGRRSPDRPFRPDRTTGTVGPAGQRERVMRRRVGAGLALWLAEELGSRIGRISTSGRLTEFAIPTPDSGPTGIAGGSDGSLWFTESPGGTEPAAKIGRITTAGVVTEFPVAGTRSANGIV